MRRTAPRALVSYGKSERSEREYSAVETAREFCRAWFEKLDLDEVIAFLAEDITFVGTGEDEFVRGKPGMTAREAGYF